MDYFDELPAQIRNQLTALSRAEAKANAANLAKTHAVLEARRYGASWGWIAACLGVSRQAAHALYGPKVQAATRDGRKETSAGPE